jgi:hypothetical protein
MACLLSGAVPEVVTWGAGNVAPFTNRSRHAPTISYGENTNIFKISEAARKRCFERESLRDTEHAYLYPTIF